MELPQLGKQCNELSCNQLDFLPLICRECSKQFCSEHFNLHSQLCNTANKQDDVELKTIDNVFVCSHDGCRETSIVPLICGKCKQHFCVSHRHVECLSTEDQALLAATKEKYALHDKFAKETKAVIDKQIENKIAEAKKREKSKKTASKVQLMRLKSKATGLKSIPSTDRVYFNIHIKKDGKVVPVFVSKTWSLGRVIDAVAVECKLTNNNNKANEKKLRLFKMEDGKILSDNMSTNLNSLLQDDVLSDGEDLIVEYVDDDCMQI